jgi:hypothetical protein
MEVPAKRARLVPRELQLLDLDDDALIMIIDKLNHKSKLQMMASCKRFEGLIGQTHQLYKNFKFRSIRYNHESRFLEMVRRKFGIVDICSGTVSREELSRPVLEFLKKIGGHILKIKFNKQAFHKFFLI